jgi:hypothetical protein
MKHNKKQNQICFNLVPVIWSLLFVFTTAHNILQVAVRYTADQMQKMA